MERRGLSQEGLKIMACITMLIDHIGATIVYDLCLGASNHGEAVRVLYNLYQLLRAVGRLSFPIYCFLLTEGAARTRDPKKYGLRLALGMLLAEVPFDLLFFGGLTWQHQSVMATLLLGFLMIRWMQRMPKLKLVAVIVCAGAAWLLHADYGWWGIALIALFALTRETENRTLLQIVGVAALCWMKGGTMVHIASLQFPLQFIGALAMVPIALYSGRKATSSKAVQWIFYLFYPVHLLALLIVTML